MSKNIENFEARETSILSNRTLSDEGKRQQLADAASKALSDFRGIGVVAKEIDDHNSQLSNRLFTVSRSKTMNGLLAFFREQEIRGHYLDMNQNERDVAFIRAAEQGQDETLLAFLDAPGGPMVTAEMKDRALDARARRLYPKEYEAYQQNILLRDSIFLLRDSVALWMRGLGADRAKVDSVLERDAAVPLMAGEQKAA